MSGGVLDGIDGPFNACCYRDSCIATQATVDTLRAQLEAAERCKVAFEEWLAKSEWVQATARPRELGKHRADVLRERIEAAEARAESAEADAARFTWWFERGLESSDELIDLHIQVINEKCPSLEKWRAAIDAAMSRTREETK